MFEYDLKNPTTIEYDLKNPSIKARENDGFFQPITTGLFGSLGRAINTVENTLDFYAKPAKYTMEEWKELSKNPLHEGVRNWATDLEKHNRVEYEPWTGKWLANGVAGVIPYAATLAPLSAMAMRTGNAGALREAGRYGATRLGAGEKVAAFAGELAPAATLGTVGALPEAEMEAQDAYDEAIAEGRSKDEALKIRNTVRNLNVAILSGTNTAQIMLVFGKSPLKLPKNSASKIAKKLFITGGVEGFQESTQEYIPDYAKDEPADWDRIAQSGTIGGAAGVMFGSFGMGANKLLDRAEKRYANNNNTNIQNDTGSITGENILKIGEQQLGKPYKLGADGVDATDCGLFTQQTFSKVGVDLGTRLADGQYRNIEVQGKTFTEASQLKPGDLVFWDVPENRERWPASNDPNDVNSNRAYKGITHVGIYAGDGKVLQAGSSGVGYMDLNHYPVVGFGRATEGGIVNSVNGNTASLVDDEILQADFATPVDFLNYMRDTLDSESDPGGNLVDLVGSALETGNEQKISELAKQLGYKESAPATSVSEKPDTQQETEEEFGQYFGQEGLGAIQAFQDEAKRRKELAELEEARALYEALAAENRREEESLTKHIAQEGAGVFETFQAKRERAEKLAREQKAQADFERLLRQRTMHHRALPAPAAVKALPGIDYGGQVLSDGRGVLLDAQAANKTNKVPRGLTGKLVKVRTDDGTEFASRYKVVPAGSLVSSHNDDHSINNNYPAALQPRNRERKAMKQQIADIVNGLRPADLSESRSINQGAPLVNSDNIVENGNGRTLALRRMYRSGHKNAPQYKQYLVDNAEKFGLDKAQVEAMPNPVLVRERASDIDVNKIITSTEGGARLAAGEQARVDAGKLRPETLDLFIENESGDLLTVANRDFTRAALSDIAHQNDINGLLDENGSISQAGIARIKNALFAKAYGDNNLLAKMSESTDNNIRNITGGLLNAAPYVSTAKAKMAEGKLHSYDLTSDVVEAAKKIMSLRDEGKPVDLYLKEQSLFDEGLSENAKNILQFLDANKQKPKNIANLLKGVSKSVQELGSPDQVSLFGDTRIPSLNEIHSKTIREIANEEQPPVFAGIGLQQDNPGNGGVVPEAGAKTQHRNGEADNLEKALRDPKALEIARRALNGHQESIKALENISPEIKKALLDKVQEGKYTLGETAIPMSKKNSSTINKKPLLYERLVTPSPYTDTGAALEAASHKVGERASSVDGKSKGFVNNSIPEAEKLFNGETADSPGKIFDEERGKNAFLEAIGKKPKEEAQPEKKRTFNLVDDSDAALANSIKEAQAELSKLSANPVFNPKLMNAAFKVGAIYLQRGVNSFADWSRAMINALGDKIKPFLNSVWDSIHAYPENVKYDERVATAVFDYVGGLYERGITNKEEIRKNFVEFAGEEYAGLVDSAYAGIIKYPGFERSENKNVVETTVEHTQGDSQRNNQNSMGQDNTGRRPLAGGGQGVSPAIESGVRARGGERVPGRGADTGGESGNRTVRQEVADDKASPAGDTDHRRSGANSAARPGQLNDRPGSPAVERTLGERPDNAAAKEIKENKLNQQADHLAKIRESLPNLLPEQHDDVYFAEKRFSSPNGMGVLFTNGTGTGKTFSGLGIAKRFSLEGKNNILIAIPNDKIISDWIKAAAEKFDLKINQLSNTKDNGKSGAVITTYANMGYNNELVKRSWDLIICDESHGLMSGEKATPTQALENLRALTYHDRGLHERFKRLHAKEYADLEALNDKQREAEAKAAESKSPQDIKTAKDLDQEYQKMYNALETKRAALVKEWEAVEKQNKPKVAFLSATPFAYVPTVDYAEGYLFEYNKSKDGGGYNVPDGREDFFIKNFGYRMRYNKLTRPDAEVNTGVMEVNFHNMLRKEGALSGRMLSIDKDYDRGFLLINDGIGNKVDEGFDWLFDYNKGEFRDLYDFIRDTYKYHEKLYLLEAIKAKHSVDTIKEYLAQGKKVVVFHDYKKGGAQHPFRPQSIPEKLQKDYTRFAALRPDLINLNLNALKSPINTFKEAFGDSLLLFNGDVPSAIREKNVQLFNDDNSGKNVILVQSDAGQAGISLHDTTGKHPRVLFNLGMPTKPTAAIQIEGRIYRVGQKSNAMFRYLNTGTNMERFAFANKIAERVSTAENLALGDDARNLKESFISAFENTIGTDAWMDYLPGSKNEGTGGRETDRAARERLSDFERAKAFYYGNMKRNSKTKSAEGIDYYATPEPLGLKMVEWANIQEGDKVLEPSAGHGAIARWFPANTENVFIEPSRELGAMAKMAGDGTLISNTFEDYYVGNKFNAIVMNPPFGTGGKTAMEHVAKAFKHLRDGGRIVALVPEGSSMNKRFDAWLESDEAKHAYLTGEISLPTATFERAGTSAKTKILLIDRHMSHEGMDGLVPRQVDLSNVKNINELFDRIKNMHMPERHKLGQAMKAEETTPAVKAADSAHGTKGLFVTGEHIHTKTGVTQYTANIGRRLSDSEYRSVAAIAKKHTGYWSNYAKVKAFLFNDAKGRNEFVNEASAFLAGEKYSISDTEKYAGKTLEEWTTAIKKAFPSAERIERIGDTFTVNMPNRNVLTVKVGQDIEFSAEDRARAEYALKRPLKPGERPAGTYRHVSNIEGIITLADIADVDTLNHEAYHAARSLALTLTEQQLLDRFFKRSEEAQADGYAKWLKDREAFKGTVIGRFFQKIFDFANKMKAAFGFENVDNVFRKIAEGEVWNRNVKTENSTGIRTFNSLTDNEKAQVAKESREFAKQLDNWKQGRLSSSVMINVGGTPDILVKLNAKKLPIQVSQKTIAKIVNPAGVAGGKHGLSIEQLKKLPEQLHDPVMVFKSATKDDSMVVLTELVDSKGRSVIAAIHLNVEHRHHMINAIASVYSKDNSVNFVTNQINNDNLLYQNKEKSRDWFLSRGLQLPKEETAKHDSSFNSILPQAKNNVNSHKNAPDVTDLKYSIRNANDNLIEKLGKFIGSQPAPNVEVKITPNEERLTIPESIFRSPNAVAANHPIFRMFYKMATKASEVQEKLRDDFVRRLKRINGFVEDATDKATLIEILWRGDMEGKQYTVQELKDEGANENVIHAYVRTRSAIEKAYNLLNDARRQVRTNSKNMNTQELSDLKNNKFAEIIKISPQKNGECLVTWKSPKTWEKDLIINEQTMALYRQDDAIQILETNELAKTNALGELEKQYQVRIRESIPDIHKRGGYLPHFFHNYFIIGNSEVVGSGKTLADAVKKANKLAEQNPNMKLFIRPKEFKFEGQDVYAAVVGDEEYKRMAEKVAKDSEMTLAEAREYLNDKVRMKPRHRFFGNMLERKGAKGYEQENIDWVLNHYFNSVSRYVALEEFKPQAISLFERYFGRYDKEYTGLAAYAKDYLAFDSK